MTPYVVKQGDYLMKIAHVLGVDADAVWNDPKNAEVTSQRDPNLLLPGDLLWVPAPNPSPLPLEGGTANQYDAALPETTVRLLFQDSSGPLANEAYVIEGLGDPINGTTGGDGGVTAMVAVHLREFQISFPARNITYPLHIGNMDPIDEPSGARMRLQNLGCYRQLSSEEVADHGDEQAVMARDRQALRAFQEARGLEATGELDDPTKAELVKAHGS